MVVKLVKNIDQLKTERKNLLRPHYKVPKFTKVAENQKSML